MYLTNRSSSYLIIRLKLNPPSYLCRSYIFILLFYLLQALIRIGSVARGHPRARRFHRFARVGPTYNWMHVSIVVVPGCTSHVVTLCQTKRVTATRDDRNRSAKEPPRDKPANGASQASSRHYFIVKITGSSRISPGCGVEPEQPTG